ncbi:MAG: hypothetical protein K1Y02_06095 [Candidatus Hydrogenedentes bacterium]|nr:hypothetical protein [Candidatus Hydrogenedentota bacterium]
MIYNWKRFWCPRESKINLADDGYLCDPDDEFGRYLNPDAKDYASIADTACLVMLGEPGIGKSRVVDEAAEGARRAGVPFISENLRQFGSEDRLVGSVFQSDLYTKWLKDDSLLELYLDSLDECLLRIGTVVPILVDQLRTAPVDRLRLRISCRTAEWPATLEEALIKYWGKDRFAVRELVPLRRQDVVAAAKAEGLETDHFMEEIQRVRAQPLAIKPVTLRFLVKTYQRDKRFPDTEADLYRQGCRILCEESQERRDSRVPFQHDPDQRFEVAKRIAAVTIFSSKYAVWTGNDEGDVPSEDLTADTLAFGVETANGRDFAVDRTAIDEALDTGLFSSRGLHRMGWAHQTYAEFLAAAYLFENGIAPEQVLGLLTDEVSGQVKVVPQLHEVAARSAAFSVQLFDTLIRHDPIVLLRSDVATADTAQREKLVKALLDLCERGELHIRLFEYHDRLRHLDYPGLAKQLRPIVVDPAGNIHARLLALEIARACAVSDFVSELLAIAIDHSASIELRVIAIDLLGETADDAVKSKLIELAEQAPEDAGGRVRGYALEVLWPRYISAEKLFSLVDTPPPEHEINRYSMFVSRGIVKHLRPEDIPCALRWVIRQKWSRHGFQHDFSRLLDGILFAAWEHFDMPDVPPLLAQAIHARLVIDHGHLMDSTDREVKDFLHDAKKRRRLLSEYVPLLRDLGREAFYLNEASIGMARPEDFPWLLEQMEKAASPTLAAAWERLCQRCYNVFDTSHTALVFDRASQSPRVREAFKWLFVTMDLDSPEAKEGRKDFEEARKWRKESSEDTPLIPPLAERIPLWLSRCEGEEPGIWWHLARELTLTPGSRQYRDEWDADITTFPGWKSADEPTRARIVAAARRYILLSDDRRYRWLKEPGTLSIEANAGYQALRLLLNYDPNFVANLDGQAWDKWIAGLLDCPLNLGKEEAEKHHEPLISMAYARSPNSVIDMVETLVLREAAHSRYINRINRVGHILDSRISERLRAMISARALVPVCAGQVAAFLIEHNDRDSIRDVLDLLDKPLPQSGEDRDFALASAAALGTVMNPEHWTVLWHVIQLDQEFGRALISKWAHSHRDNRVLDGLTDNQLAEFYIWVVRQFPYNEDPHPKGAHTVEPREQIAHWRDNSLLQILKHRGSFSSCEALATVRDALPEAAWLNYTLQEAVTLTRARNWQPLKPEHVLRLVMDRNSRVVSNGIQLLAVIVESLGRLQTELHGENPSIRDVWDYNRAEKTWRPIDENALSDYVGRFLRRDIGDRGIVVNREVHIRPGHGQPGERTDIHVDAVSQTRSGVSDTITCIVEVKGCWHPELVTSMKAQLVDRYLHKNQCPYGLYLIGWFKCESWDLNDARNAATPDLHIDQARSQFGEQAVDFSASNLTVMSFVLDLGLGRNSVE